MSWLVGSITVLLIALGGAVYWFFKQGKTKQELDNINSHVKDKNKFLKRLPDILRDSNYVLRVRKSIKNWRIKSP